MILTSAEARGPLPVLVLLAALLLVSSVVPAQTECAEGERIAGRYFITEDKVNMRDGPGNDYPRIVNELASATLGGEHYRMLWTDDVLEGRCRTEEWLQGKLVEIDGDAVNGPVGWVRLEFVSATPSTAYRTGLDWDIASDPGLAEADRALARRGSLAVLRQVPECARVIGGYRSYTEGEGFFVTCTEDVTGVPFNVRFAAAGPDGTIRIFRPDPYPRTAARQLCHNRIRMTVANAAVLELERDRGYTNQALANGNRIVLQTFRTSNMMGEPTGYQAECLVLPNGEITMTVYETGPRDEE